MYTTNLRKDVQKKDTTRKDYNREIKANFDELLARLRKAINDIPSPQIQVDWNQTQESQFDFIKNKPDIPEPTEQFWTKATTTLSPLTTGDRLEVIIADSNTQIFGRNNNVGPGISGYAISGIGVDGYSSSGSGIRGQSVTGLGGNFQVTPSSTNTSVEIQRLTRGTSGTAQNNIGGYISWRFARSGGGTEVEQSRFNSLWTNATTGAETSQFEWWLKNNGSSTLSKVMNLDSVGKLSVANLNISSLTEGVIKTDSSGNLSLASPGVDFELNGAVSTHENNYDHTKLHDKVVQIKIISDTTTLTTGDSKLIFCIPEELDGYILTSAHAFVTTVSSLQTPTIQIRNITVSNVDLLTTEITIDVNEYTSYTSTTQPVIDENNNLLSGGDLIAIDIDVAGTGAKGLGIILKFQLL